jgi:DedD protein
MVNTLVKERLTGAVILVALIVVLVPELLTGPIRPAVRARGATPSAEEPPLRSYTIDLADGPQGGAQTLQPQPASSAAPVAPAVEPPVAPAASAATAAEQAPPPRAAATTPANAPAPAASPAAPTAAAPAPAPAAASATGWIVQIGSFASRENAERLAQHVHGLGFQVSVSRGTTGRRLYRVQVGPARDHAAAEQILSKLHAQGLKGSVLAR